MECHGPRRCLPVSRRGSADSRSPGPDRRRMQMKGPNLLYGVAAEPIVGGCAAHEGARPKRTVQASGVAPLTPRVAKEEVQRGAGGPFFTIFLPRLQAEVFDYHSMFGGLTCVADIHFHMQV